MQTSSPETQLDYPTIADRLTEAHKLHPEISISTEIVSFEHQSLAVTRATVTTSKGTFSASGVASEDKDPERLDSLLEISETRAVSRALRLSGCCVEKTGAEEIPTPTGSPASSPQMNYIRRLAKERRWDVIEASRRILKRPAIQRLDELNKSDASAVIKAMKSVA